MTTLEELATSDETGTIQALIDELAAKQRRLDFCIRWFMNPAVWDEETIDEAIAVRIAKGFD